MNDDEWNQLVSRLESSSAGLFASMIPRTVIEASLRLGEQHPLARLLLVPEGGESRVTHQALERINGWLGRAAGKPHRSWVEQKIGKLTDSDEAEATSRLAELRALGTLLSTSDAPGSLFVAPNPTSGKRKSPDLLVSSSPSTFIEVCCARWNDGERARQERLDSAEATMLPEATEKAKAAALETPGARIVAKASTAWMDPDGRTERHEMTVGAMAFPGGEVATFTLAHRTMQPQGRPKDEAEAHAVARSVSGKKPPGQVPSGSPGILWMDFCDTEWALHVADTLPAMVEWKEMPLATTRGVWHAFYGKKGKTPFFTRAAISLGLGDEMANVSVQQFDARLRNDAHRCWSAAVLRCLDGVVVFENPNPLVPLPFPVLRELVGLQGYEPELSFHRLAEDDFDGLRGRLEDVEKRLRFYIGVESTDQEDEHD